MSELGKVLSHLILKFFRLGFLRLEALLVKLIVLGEETAHLVEESLTKFLIVIFSSMF